MPPRQACLHASKGVQSDSPRRRSGVSIKFFVNTDTERLFKLFAKSYP